MKAVTPEELGFSSARLGRIDAFMQGLIDKGRVAGGVTLIARHGKLAHFASHGLMDVEAGKPMRTDTIFRIYSMTKPVTAVATMMLYEEGCFLLEDSIADYLPEFAQTRAFVRETPDGMELADLEHPITIRHLLTHTSGLTYDNPSGTPVERMYAQEQIFRPDETLEVKIPRLARLPLAHQPGTAWAYSASLDVLGRLVEVVSGKTYDVFLKERIFDPLGMPDTGFHVPRQNLGRLATVYTPGESGKLQRDESPERDRSAPPAYLAGGGGLCSTASDYARFAQMLLNGGELDGARLLGLKTADMITSDQVSRYRIPFPPQGLLWDVMLSGQSFGLGGSVVVGFGHFGTPRSVGSYSWDGAASTHFWIDPKEGLVGMILLQLMPLDPRPTQTFEVLAYQALTG